MISQRSVYYCPFCQQAVAEMNIDLDKPTPLAVEYDRVETAIRTHLLRRHPIARRLNRQVRRAMRQSRLALGEGTAFA